MKKTITKKFAALVAATTVALAATVYLWAVGPQDWAAFNGTVEGLGGENANQGNFLTYYEELNARDPWLGLWLSIMYPWLTSGE